LLAERESGRGLPGPKLQAREEHNMASSTQTTTAAGGAPVEQFDAIIVGAGLSGLMFQMLRRFQLARLRPHHRAIELTDTALL
jgi:hypothetical protein